MIGQAAGGREYVIWLDCCGLCLSNWRLVECFIFYYFWLCESERNLSYGGRFCDVHQMVAALTCIYHQPDSNIILRNYFFIIAPISSQAHTAHTSIYLFAVR